MSTLIILCIIVLILLPLFQIRVGGTAEYSSDGFTAYAVIGCFNIALFPRPKLTPLEREKKAEAQAKKVDKKKEKQKKAEKKKSAKKGFLKSTSKKRSQNEPKESETVESGKNKIGGTVELIIDLLPILGRFLAGMGRKIRVDRMNIEMSVGGADAAAVALTYGRISSVGPYIVRWTEENLDLKEHHIQVTPDFMGGSTTIAIQAKLTYTIGQLLHIILKAGISALAVFLKHKLNRNNKR